MVLSYATCTNILIFTFKIITLSKDLYWNSKTKHSSNVWNKCIGRKLLNRSEWVYVTRCIFDACRNLIKNFDSKIKGPFWKVVKFAVGVCNSEWNLVLILWIYEFDSYESLFLATEREKIVCDFHGRIFRFFNNWRQESLFLAFIIILIFLFWVLKILELYAELPHKIMPHNRMEWKYEK